jgi:hypothetical protein
MGSNVRRCAARPIRVAVPLLLLLLLAVAACSGSGTDAMSEKAADGGAADSGAVAEAPQALSEAESASGADAAALRRSTVQTRAVIRTGSVFVVTKDLSEARAKVDRMLVRLDGYISQEQSDSDARGRPESSTLQLRVPEPAFDETMSELKGLGRLEEATRDSEDVTTQVIDIDSRVSTQEASLRRLESFLGRAVDIDDVIRLESEIARRQAELESLKAQQKYLADQTSLATITLYLSTPDVIVEPPSRLEDAGFLAGLRSGWNAMKVLLVGTATVLGALVPFAVALLVLAVPVWLLVRASAHRRAALRPAPAGGTEPDAPPASDSQ